MAMRRGGYALGWLYTAVQGRPYAGVALHQGSSVMEWLCARGGYAPGWLCAGVALRWGGYAPGWLCAGVAIRWGGYALGWLCAGVAMHWVAMCWGGYVLGCISLIYSAYALGFAFGFLFLALGFCF